MPEKTEYGFTDEQFSAVISLIAILDRPMQLRPVLRWLPLLTVSQQVTFLRGCGELLRKVQPGIRTDQSQNEPRVQKLSFAEPLKELLRQVLSFDQLAHVWIVIKTRTGEEFLETERIFVDAVEREILVSSTGEQVDLFVAFAIETKSEVLISCVADAIAVWIGE
ncbi:MAG: hypothetical protein ABI758_01805 [Candidatus Woesebacteria bacterium]